MGKELHILIPKEPEKSVQNRFYERAPYCSLSYDEPDTQIIRLLPSAISGYEGIYGYLYF